MAFKPAVRTEAKLRLGLCGPSGSGKTYSAILLALGICGDPAKIALIDTEHKSASLYDSIPASMGYEGTFATDAIEAPYTISKYSNMILEAEKGGFEVIILDSISHAWEGEGGLLDQHKQATDRSAKKDSFAAWREITPMHNKFIESMLKSKCHIIATMRSKTEHEIVRNQNGKNTVQKLGLKPVQREGMDYEFTIVLDIDRDTHAALASKDRSNLFNEQVNYTPSAITLDTGKRIKSWLDSAESLPPSPPPPKDTPPADEEATRKKGLSAINAFAGSLGIDHDTLSDWACGKAKVESMANLTAAQLRTLYKQLADDHELQQELAGTK